MEKPESKLSDWLALYQRYEKWKKDAPGAVAELRRVAAPDDLIKVPAFYRLTRGYGSNENIRRLVYCLPRLSHKDGGASLGEALANGRISEKRLFMVIRSQAPNDVIQLRRLLQQVEPTVDIVRTSWLLISWHKPEQKQKLLEDFFLHQKESV